MEVANHIEAMGGGLRWRVFFVEQKKNKNVAKRVPGADLISNWGVLESEDVRSRYLLRILLTQKQHHRLYIYIYTYIYIYYICFVS